MALGRDERAAYKRRPSAAVLEQYHYYDTIDASTTKLYASIFKNRPGSQRHSSY
jgi:hypothetical protein